LAKSGHFSPVATGLFFWKMAIFGHFWRKRPKKAFLRVLAHKRAFWALFGPLAQGFYINPSRGGSQGPGRSQTGSRTLSGGLRGPWSPGPGIPGSPDPSARGRGRPQTPSQGPGDPGSPGSARGFTSTPRAGAPRYRRARALAQGPPSPQGSWRRSRPPLGGRGCPPTIL